MFHLLNRKQHCVSSFHLPVVSGRQSEDYMAAEPRVLRSFVNGAYVEPSEAATTDLVSPVTGELIATCLLYTSPSPRD